MRTQLILVFVSPLVGCASVQVNPAREVATTQAPFEAKLGFNLVSVAEGSNLEAATVDGRTAFCTSNAAWFALGESRPVCFFDSIKSGYLDKYYVLGTLRSLTYDAHIPYSMIDRTVSKVPSANATPAPLDPEYVRIQRLRDPQFGVESKTDPETLASDQLAAVRAKRDAGKKLSSADRSIIAAGDRADADAKQREEARQQAALDQARRYDAEQRAVAADQIVCEYESHSAGYVGYHRSLGDLIGASIGAAAEQTNVMRLCLNARAASRQ